MTALKEMEETNYKFGLLGAFNDSKLTQIGQQVALAGNLETFKIGLFCLRKAHAGPQYRDHFS